MNDLQNPSAPRGTLPLGTPHPAAHSAMIWLRDNLLNDPARVAMMLESLSSCAIESNLLGEVCAETLGRLLRGEPVSDRYLLGLAWTVRAALENR